MGIFIPHRSRGYGNAFQRRGHQPRKPLAEFSFDAVDVWSAAAAATRINGGYLKEPQFKYSEEQRTSVQVAEPNRTLVFRMLKESQAYSKEDADRGAAARAHWQAALLRVLSDTANDFERTAVRVADQDKITTTLDLAVLCSLVASAERAVQREEMLEAKRVIPSQYQGKTGDKLNIRGAQVITVRYKDDFGKYWIEATADGNLYAWWGQQMEVGSVVDFKGRVKRHFKDHNADTAVTQLNYVKVQIAS